MKAALLEDGQLVIRDIATPEPRADEVLVRLSSAGVCHSDVHIVRGDWSGLRLSGRLGHEGIGIVESLGTGADRFAQVGDRVIVGLGGSGGGYWCGACEYCLGGRPRLCSQTKGIMGTYAECLRVNARSVVPLPETVGDREVPLACAGLTAYGAVKKLLKYHVLPGKPVAIIGAAGGLGHYAVQIATAFGYNVVGVDVGADRVDFVRSLGAHTAVEAKEAEAVVTGRFGGVAASLVFSPRMAGFDLGMQLLGRGGLFVSVGIPASDEGKIQISPLDLFLKDIVIVSSAVGNVQDMRELVALAADGKVRTHVSRAGRLSDLGQILDELEAGAFAGRAILDDLTA
jgi:propanol-preferring alcohol dehydrogenase